jgi:hypothetical protein
VNASKVCFKLTIHQECISAFYSQEKADRQGIGVIAQPPLVGNYASNIQKNRMFAPYFVFVPVVAIDLLPDKNILF